ncbi:MAG: proton-conducting transporter membrane subunit, partial [Chthoniobacteraceae bacterium]|nr:proton-conducting transporter membrane subunit [Chthoniobacteraceae bacterium]
RMLYDRTHTRDIATLGGMNLSKALPFAAFTFTLASAASMGMPGFSGFMAEINILLGAWEAFPALLIFAMLGAGVTVAFTLRALQRSFFPSLAAAAAAVAAAPHGEEHEPLPPITLPERLGAAILIAATLAAGLFPKFLIDPILHSFDSPQSLMHHLIQGVAQ